MALSRIGGLIREFVAKTSNQIGSDLAHGSGADSSSYNRQVGQVEGLEMVMREIERIEGEL